MPRPVDRHPGGGSARDHPRRKSVPVWTDGWGRRASYAP